MKKFIVAVLVGLAGNAIAQQPAAPLLLPDVEAGANAGSADAQFELGRRLFNGTGVPRDPNAAIRWLERAAAQGHVRSQATLGAVYQTGTGATKDFERARKYLTEAAGAGDVQALTLLGLMDAQGQGLPAPDKVSAEKRLREAVAKGHMDATPPLAVVLMGTTAEPGPSPAEGLGALRRAALAGHSRSAYSLFLAYGSGQNNVPRDEREAARWLAVAAKGGLADAQVAMAMALREGRYGLGKEPREAYFWSSLAARQMNPAALVLRGEFEKDLTPNEIADAQQQLRTWKPTTAPDARSGRLAVAGLEVPRTYASHQITRDNFATVVRECLPTYPDTAVDRVVRAWDFPRKNAITLLSDPKTAGTFAIYESTAICVKESDAGFPVLAGESFVGTIEPEGVPEAVRYEWFATVAKLIAAKGYAEVVYQFPNGNGFPTLYRPTPTGLRVEYRTSFRKAGEYDPKKYDAVFTHPDMKSVSTSAYGQRQEKFVLTHRFRGLPPPSAGGLPPLPGALPTY